MKDAIYKISLDIYEHTSQAALKAKKTDTGRKLHITLRAGSAPYTIEDDCYAAFKATKPDGTILFNACTIENNEIIYEFTEQTCTTVGRLRCEIALYGPDDKIITSPRFTLLVDGTIYPEEIVESASEFSILVKLIDKVKEAINATKQLANEYEQYFDITADGLVSLKDVYRGTGDANYDYSRSDNGVGAVGSKNSELPAVLVIPDIVNKITVTALAPAMFMLNNAVKSITIPSHITEIPEKFCSQAKNLEEIHGTSNVEILSHAALQVTRLKKVAFPKLREISGRGHFSGCVYLVSADMGDAITELPGICFYYCESLESILGGASITKIGDNALRGTHRLKNVSFAANLKEISDNGFNASGLNHYWHTHYGCDFGTFATPAQWNPTDYWSGCTYKPCVTQLRSTFNQQNPEWSKEALNNREDLADWSDDEKGYADNCMMNAAVMAYSILEEVDISSPVDFIKAVRDENPKLTAEHGASDVKDGLPYYFDELGFKTEQYEYVGNLQKLYDALAEGHLVLSVIIGQHTTYHSHAALFYGITENGEIMVCDSESYRTGFSDYTAITYTKPIQNMVMAVLPSGTKEIFTIVKKKEKEET